LERTTAVGYQENDSDIHAVGKLSEDVRDAIIEYQVSPIFCSPLECTVKPVSSSLSKMRCTVRIAN
jgi:hypothetical protein